MVNQQHHQQQQWPLKDENNEELILPSDLYWNYVFYPYTAVDDRIIINKRTKSTQHYAGHRAEINDAMLKAGDSEYLAEYHRAIHTSVIIQQLKDWVTNISSINIKDIDLLANTIIEWENVDGRQPLPLDLLRRTRWSWDKHISTIESSSERLNACLHFFHGSFAGSDMPLLFCGQACLEDVVNVKFHTLIDPNSVNGPVKKVDTEFNAIFPQTVFGVWLDRYLRHAHSL